MKFNPGFNIEANNNKLGFIYGNNVFGPEVEIRYLDDIRKNLLDYDSIGPNEVYAIAMDVGDLDDYEAIVSRNLLYGAVTYARGQIGQEPVRSQGHIHKVSKSCQSSTCEIYEIWEGHAIIYMQEYATDNPGCCVAIYAEVGDIVVVPPYWVHATINADVNTNLSFGAWCVRDYGFDYEDVRAHHGIAYFPIVNEGKIDWLKNTNYQSEDIIIMKARSYEEFNIKKGIPIYSQFKENNDLFNFVARPGLVSSIWKDYKL